MIIYKCQLWTNRIAWVPRQASVFSVFSVVQPPLLPVPDGRCHVTQRRREEKL